MSLIFFSGAKNKQKLFETTPQKAYVYKIWIVFFKRIHVVF